MIVEEGKQAIDGNEQHPVFDTSPESFVLGNYFLPTFKLNVIIIIFIFIQRKMKNVQ